jgi:hypothetical protein
MKGLDSIRYGWTIYHGSYSQRDEGEVVDSSAFEMSCVLRINVVSDILGGWQTKLWWSGSKNPGSSEGESMMPIYSATMEGSMWPREKQTRTFVDTNYI